MNTQDLISEISSVVRDRRFDRPWYLRQVNRAMLAIASRVLLPGLSGGKATVDTLTTDYQVDLPDDYHRELYLAKVGGTPMKIYGNMGVMIAAGHHMDINRGSITAVTVNGAKLVYQSVPALVTEIEILYYRKPTEQEDKRTSIVDELGFEAAAEDPLDEAILAYVANIGFSRIEQGIDGQKIDTAYYADQFETKIDILSAYGKRRPRVEPPVCRVRWP
jgi:hypothetical protein